MRALALCALLVPALAVAAPEDVKQKQRQAQEQLIAGDTDAALKLVDEGLRLAPGDAELLLLRGHVLLKASDYNGALTAYRQYLATGAKGPNRREVVRIVASLEQASTTFLAVNVGTGPADVRVDTRAGKPFCVANPECKRGIVPGDHLVIVDKAGAQRVTRRIDVPAGQTARVDIKLTEKAAPLTLRTTPVDAIVVVDGGAVPAELAPGEHVIDVTRPGYFAERRSVRAVAGQALTVEIDLREAMAVSVTPAGATITVDGKVTQVVDGAVPRGRVVTVTAPGYRGETVNVPPGAPLEISLLPLGAQAQLAGAPRGATFTVDGRKLPLEGASEVGPGSHTLEVNLPGRPRFRRTVSLSPGDTALVSVEAQRGGRPKAIVSALIAVGGLASGAYFGVKALDEKKQFDARATQSGVGPMEAMQKMLEEDGKRHALYADISFGVSLVAVVCAIYWFRTEGRDVEGRVEVKAGAGTVGVAGSW